MTDRETERILQSLRGEVEAAFADELLCLAIFGSAAGPDFVPGRSDINVAIVLRAIGVPQLAILQRHVPAWRVRGIATPILLDPEFLAHAADAFPMEFQDIQARHRVLSGSNLFASLRVDPACLRFQLEQEVRSKQLRLRLAFVETAGQAERVEQLMLRSIKSFVAILRSLVRWRSASVASEQWLIVDEFERLFATSVPALRHVLAVKLGRESWQGPAEESFPGYLADVGSLVQIVDRLHGAA